jgi:hypothetical protein
MNPPGATQKILDCLGLLFNQARDRRRPCHITVRLSRTPYAPERGLECDLAFVCEIFVGLPQMIQMSLHAQDLPIWTLESL